MKNELFDIIGNVSKVFCDMDGVLADFEGQARAIDRFDKEEGFFSNLTPFYNNLHAINILLNYGADIYILTASPNKQADLDKLEWIEKYMPEFPKDHIIICRTGESKAKQIGSHIKGALLLDDYSGNLIDWKEKGGVAVKVLNKYDNPVGKHTKHNIPYVNTLLELV